MRLLLSTIFFLSSFVLFAQKQGNVWYFGVGYGLDFNSSPPVLLNDGQTSYREACGQPHIEGTATISDSLGNFLFYTDGRKVWDKTHMVMPHGNNLRGGTSSTQSSLIVPTPGKDSEYYIFTTDDFCNDLSWGMRYSVVDMCLNEGKGDVLLGKKNILLLETASEKITAVRHANSVDYWVIGQKYFTNQFYAYLLTNQGIADTIVSEVGSVHTGSGGSNSMWSALGQIKVSPLGNRIAVGAANCGNILEVFDFNDLTGIVSNPISLPSPCGAYGVSFSPDGTKLYETPILTQYDLDAGGGNPDSIIESAFEFPNQFQICFNGLQLGPNGKIYMYDCSGTSISVIGNPNQLGLTSNTQLSIYQTPSQHIAFTFSNMIDSYSYTSTGICSPNYIPETITPTAKIYPNPFTGQTTIQLSQAIQNGTLQLHDAFGRLVKQEVVQGQQFALHQSGLPAGLYFLSLYEQEQKLGTWRVAISE